MALHLHTLSYLEHSDFISQERKDPFTGKTLQSGDIVVFCAKCKTAFLLDSWEAVNSKHCNQYDTLSQFPPQIEILTLKKKKSVYVEIFDLIVLFLQTVASYRQLINSRLIAVIAMVILMKNTQACKVHFIISTIFFPLSLITIFLGIVYSLPILAISLAVSGIERHFDLKSISLHSISELNNFGHSDMPKFLYISFYLSFLCFFSLRNIFNYIKPSDAECGDDDFLYGTVWVLYFCLLSLFIINIDIWLYIFTIIFILIMQTLFLKIAV